MRPPLSWKGYEDGADGSLRSFDMEVMYTNMKETHEESQTVDGSVFRFLWWSWRCILRAASKHAPR